MIVRIGAVFILATAAFCANATMYPLPTAGNDLVGKITHIKTQASDNLDQLAINYDLGYTEIKQANPTVDPWLPGEGTQLTLPTQHILPDAPREGIVLNLAEMRVYYYPPAGSDKAGNVVTFPVGIGRKGWNTPLGKARIVRKKAHPDWHPPASIRKEHAEKGDPLPRVVPAGPDNPLGQYALYLNLPGYLMHGTNKPSGIGLRVSHGCVRFYPKDIAKMFKMVSVGTAVDIVNQPYKTGWNNGRLYLEVHPPDAVGREHIKSYTPVTQAIINATRDKPDYPVNWKRVEQVSNKASGVAQPIGPAVSSKDE